MTAGEWNRYPLLSTTGSATLSASLLTVATLSACSVLPINPFHGAFSKGTSLDALTTTTHVQELKDRGANQVELLALQLENGELGSVAVTVPATASSPRTWSQWHLDDSDGSQFSDEPLDDVLGAITTFSPTEAPIADPVATVHKRATEDPRCSAPDMLTHVSYRVTPSRKASVETFCAPSDDIVNRNGELTITDDVAGLPDPSSAAAGDGASTIDRPLNLLQADDMRTLLHYAGAFFGDTLRQQGRRPQREDRRGSSRGSRQLAPLRLCGPTNPAAVPQAACVKARWATRRGFRCGRGSPPRRHTPS